MTHVKYISTREILKDERKRKIDFQQVREVIKTDDSYKLFKELRGHYDVTRTSQTIWHCKFRDSFMKS